VKNNIYRYQKDFMIPVRISQDNVELAGIKRIAERIISISPSEKICIYWGEKKEGEATREVYFIIGFISTIGKINKMASEN